MRLLVLACSQRKNADPSPLPAIERYDGVLFRVYRKWRAQAGVTEPHVIIVSARHGLLVATDLVEHYDQCMNRDRAEELRTIVNTQLAEHLAAGIYRSVFLGLAGRYKLTVDPHLLDQSGVPVEWISGPIGAQAAQLKHWLQRETCGALQEDAAPYVTSNGPTALRSVKLRGTVLALTPDESMQCARRALADDAVGAQEFHSWYALIDGQRVSTKWLVRALTGLPLGAFSTDEARRVLAQLGIRVYPNDGRPTIDLKEQAP